MASERGGRVHSLRSPSVARGRIGAWSKGGEFLGEARIAGGSEGSLASYAHCSVSRGTEGHGVRFTLHAFDGGYRVLVEEWGEEDRALWLALEEEEEESYVGLLSEEEVREAFPYLLAALEMPDGIGVNERGSEAS